MQVVGVAAGGMPDWLHTCWRRTVMWWWITWAELQQQHTQSSPRREGEQNTPSNTTTCPNNMLSISAPTNIRSSAGRQNFRSSEKCNKTDLLTPTDNPLLSAVSWRLHSCSYSERLTPLLSALLRKAVLSVRLSVCLSVTLVIYAYAVQDVEMYFAPNDGAMFLVSWRPISRFWVYGFRGVFELWQASASIFPFVCRTFK